MFLIYNHVKYNSALHSEQQLFHAIKTMHFSRPTYVKLFRYLMLEVIILKEIHGFPNTTVYDINEARTFGK